MKNKSSTSAGALAREHQAGLKVKRNTVYINHEMTTLRQKNQNNNLIKQNLLAKQKHAQEG